MNRKKELIVVCGPTASGKTSLGVALAGRYQGEIISCDSRQVYKGMDIGTGKDLNEYCTDQGIIPFHLIDNADPKDVYTVYHYKSDFFKVFDELSNQGTVPIMVGGSGLYVEAVLRNFSIPQIPENPTLREELMQKEKSWLIQELSTINPVLFEKTDTSSKKRIVRALEISYCKDTVQPNELESGREINPLVFCTVWERTELRERIAKRLESRLEQGMIDEVRLLLDSGVPRERLALFGMEYKHIALYLDREVTYDIMVEKLRNDIYHLAKRQETWFRGMERRGISVNWIKQASVEDAAFIADSYFEVKK